MTVGVLSAMGPRMRSSSVLTLPITMLATSAMASSTSSSTALYSDISMVEARWQASCGVQETLPVPIHGPARPTSARTPDSVPADLPVNASPASMSMPSIMEKTSRVAPVMAEMRLVSVIVCCSVSFMVSPKIALHAGIEAGNFTGADHAIDIQQDLHLAFELGHAQNERGAQLFAEIGRVLDIGSGKIHDLGHGVNHQPDLNGSGVTAHLHDHDAGALRVFDLRQSELQPQIDHGNNLAAEVDDAFQVNRRLRHGRDLLDAHDLSYFVDANAELLRTKAEGQVLACAVISEGGVRTGPWSRERGGLHSDPVASFVP